jgi:uncharacterized integral membrane protein
MWRLVKLVLWLGVLVAGILVGVSFVTTNPTVVNVQFPFIGRESGEVVLGVALLGATATGIGIALLMALVTSIAMTFHVARLKREIRSLRKEVDALRNLPILDEEMDGDAEVADLEESGVLGAVDREIASGPVRGGSTVAPIGDDEDDEPASREEESDDEDEIDERADHLEGDRPESKTRAAGTPSIGGTRKIDVP